MHFYVAKCFLKPLALQNKPCVKMHAGLHVKKPPFRIPHPPGSARIHPGQNINHDVHCIAISQDLIYFFIEIYCAGVGRWHSSNQRSARPVSHRRLILMAIKCLPADPGDAALHYLSGQTALSRGNLFLSASARDRGNNSLIMVIISEIDAVCHRGAQLGRKPSARLGEEESGGLKAKIYAW